MTSERFAQQAHAAGIKEVLSKTDPVAEHSDRLVGKAWEQP